MSFGFGVGDFLAVGKLALPLYNACADAPAEFEELKRDLSSIHTVISCLQAQAEDRQSLLRQRCADRKPEWKRLRDNLLETLLELQELITKYKEMGRNAFMRVRLGVQKLHDLRGKLSLHLTAINTFVASLSLSALGRMEPVLGRIECLLAEFVKEERRGQKPRTILSAHDEGGGQSWKQMKLDLMLEGISREDFERNEERIKEILDWVINDGQDLGTLAEVNVDDSISQQGKLEPQRTNGRMSSKETERNLQTAFNTGMEKKQEKDRASKIPKAKINLQKILDRQVGQWNYSRSPSVDITILIVDEGLTHFGLFLRRSLHENTAEFTKRPHYNRWYYFNSLNGDFPWRPNLRIHMYSSKIHDKEIVAERTGNARWVNALKVMKTPWDPQLFKSVEDVKRNLYNYVLFVCPGTNPSSLYTVAWYPWLDQTVVNIAKGRTILSPYPKNKWSLRSHHYAKLAYNQVDGYAVDFLETYLNAKMHIQASAFR